MYVPLIAAAIVALHDSVSVFARGYIDVFMYVCIHKYICICMYVYLNMYI